MSEAAFPFLDSGPPPGSGVDSQQTPQAVPEQQAIDYTPYLQSLQVALGNLERAVSKAKRATVHDDLVYWAEVRY